MMLRKDVLPFFKKAENNKWSVKFHGNEGPLEVSNQKVPDLFQVRI